MEVNAFCRRPGRGLLVVLTLLLCLPVAARATETARTADMLVLPEPAFAPLEVGPPLRIAEASGVEPLAVLAEASTGARDQLEALAAWNAAGRLPMRNGFSRPLPLSHGLRLDSGDLAAKIGRHQGGVIGQSAPDRFVWGAEVRVEGAHRLRLHLADVELPAGAQLWVYGETGEARGPFGAELLHEGRLVTPSVAGPVARFELEVAAAITEPIGFVIDRVTELFALDATGAPAVGPKLGECLIDASCIGAGTFAPVDFVRKAIGQMVFEANGDSFICTGALLNDRDDSTVIPYFLTANHCLSRQAVASTLEVTWDFHTRACGGNLPGSFPTSNGARLLVSNPQSDFTLLELDRIPAGRVLLGWDASPLPPGTVVHRVSHPFGAPQTYSRSRLHAPSCYDPGTHLEASMQAGGTFGGSSGAALLLATGQVVGQLDGGCGVDPDDGCNYANVEGDGAFAHTLGFIDDLLNRTGSGGGPPPPAGPWLRSPALPGFEAKVLINDAVLGSRETDCIAETLCVSGALAGRPEIFVKVIGPRPNGYLWAQISRFTPSKVEVWLRQTSSGEVNHYQLDAVPAASDDVSGLQDKEAFLP